MVHFMARMFSLSEWGVGGVGVAAVWVQFL